MPRIKLEKTIKNNLGQILKDKKMTAEDLAAKIHTTPATISRFKNLKTNLSMDSIIDITQVLGITIGELFGEIPVNYKDIKNIRYFEDINKFNDCSELDNKDFYSLFGISTELMKIFEIIVDLKNIIITKTSNNSMYPTISTTDFIIIDLSQKIINRDGLYLIVEQGRLEVRRLTINEREDKVRITLDNEKYMGNLGKNDGRKEIEKSVCGKVIKILKRDNY